VMPYASAVAAAYGKDTVEKIHDLTIEKASNATVGMAHRLLGRILRRKESSDAVESALADLANGEEDSEAALRLQIRKALTADPELAREVADMLNSSSHNTSASRSISIGKNDGFAITGDQAFIVGSQQNHGSGIFIGRDYRFSRNDDDARS